MQFWEYFAVLKRKLTFDLRGKELSKLNLKRAKQIASSPIMANVTFEGMPVYIERVNDITGTAHIYPLDEPGMRREVFISELTEEI